MKTHILILMLAVTHVLAQKKEKQSITLNTGITMKYVEAGNAGDVVIFLHGFTDTSRSFYETVDALEKIDPTLKLYVLDQRGHGDSSMPPASTCAAQPEKCFSADAMAKDVIAFMNQKKIQKATIVGHSMGSVITQELALSYPQRINKIILIGSFVNGTKSAIVQDFLTASIETAWQDALLKQPGFSWPADAYLLKPSDLDASVTQWIKEAWVVDPIANEQLIEAVYPETMQTHLGTWIGIVRMLREFDNSTRLRNLNVPVLVLWATQDNAFPENPEQVELRKTLQMAAEKNNITYHYKVYGKIPLPASGMQESDLGHNLQWGAPQEVAADIHSFIRFNTPKKGLPHASSSNLKHVVVD